MGEAAQGPISWGETSLSKLDMYMCAQIGLALRAPLAELSYGKEPCQYWHTSSVALMERGADAAVSLQESLRGSSCCGSGLAGRSTLQVGVNLSVLRDSCAS